MNIFERIDAEETVKGLDEKDGTNFVGDARGYFRGTYKLPKTESIDYSYIEPGKPCTERSLGVKMRTQKLYKILTTMAAGFLSELYKMNETIQNLVEKGVNFDYLSQEKKFELLSQTKERHMLTHLRSAGFTFEEAWIETGKNGDWIYNFVSDFNIVDKEGRVLLFELRPSTLEGVLSQRPDIEIRPETIQKGMMRAFSSVSSKTAKNAIDNLAVLFKYGKVPLKRDQVYDIVYKKMPKWQLQDQVPQVFQDFLKEVCKDTYSEKKAKTPQKTATKKVSHKKGISPAQREIDKLFDDMQTAILGE